MQTANNPRRITGMFVKQIWVGRKNNEAMTIGRVKFDATRAVLLRDLDCIRSMRDSDESSDEIGRECVSWDGPCEVYLTESVVEFFGLGDEEEPDLMIEQVTQEMLDKARAEFGALEGDTITLELNLKVSYRLNGLPSDAMSSNLQRMVEQSIGNGMLTGESAAEVNEYSMNVVVLTDETVIEGA